MPTCSQAKILTNLESGIQSRRHSNNNKMTSKEEEDGGILPFIDLHEASNSGPIQIHVNDYYTTTKDHHYSFDIQHSNTNHGHLKSVHLNNNNTNTTTTSNKNRNSNRERKFHGGDMRLYPNPTLQNKRKQGYYNQNNGRQQRRISIDEIPVNNQYEIPKHRLLNNKAPIIFDDHIKKSSYPPSFLYNSPYKAANPLLNPSSSQSMSMYNMNMNMNNNNNTVHGMQKHYILRSVAPPILSKGVGEGSDGEGGNEDNHNYSGTSEDYNENSSGDNKSTNDLTQSPRSQNQTQNQNINNTRIIHTKLPSARRSIDCGQLKKMTPEESKIYLATKAQEMRRRNSLLNQNQNILSTNFPRIALEIESIDNEIQALDQKTNHVNLFNIKSNSYSNKSQEPLNSPNHHRDLYSLNAKRLLALASIRPSLTFHKSMSPEEISILKKYYQLLKPKIPQQNDNASKDLDIVQPTIMYDTAKINLTSLHSLKTFLDKHKKEIASGEEQIEYDENNDGAPAGFVLKNVEKDLCTKFPTETNDAFFALAVMNETNDKAETKMAEANLYRVLNWNDTSALCNAMATTKKPSIHSQTASTSIKQSSSLHSSTTASLISAGSSGSTTPTAPAELSFDYIKNLSNLVGNIVPTKLAKQLKTTSIDVSNLPGGSNEEIPSFEELGINLSSLINSDNNNNSNNKTASNPNPNSNSADQDPNNMAAQSNQVPIQTSKLKITAYRNLKEKVNTTKIMWFNGPPDRKPLSVIFEIGGDEIGHEKIIEEATKALKNTPKKGAHLVSIEFVPRSVHLGSVYVENQWILTLDSQDTKFFLTHNGINIDGHLATVQSYDEFIFSEFEKFIRVEKYKNLIKNHEKAVEKNSKKYAHK